MNKLIALIDCDSFFVSCEQAADPSLKGLPVVVTTGERGCIVSRSKEAKALGVKMGAPVFMDRKEHSGIIYICARHSFYSAVSKRVMETVKKFSPVVEVSSIDEAYIDLTGTERLYKATPEEIARRIRDEIKSETDIPVSVGISLTKTLAKLACDKSKSSGDILYINDFNRREILKSAQTEEICGIGKSAARSLKMIGIFSAYELLNAPDTLLRKAGGKNILDLKYELSGIMAYPIEYTEKPPKSIQDTSALPDFTHRKEDLKHALRSHVHRAARRLRGLGGFCNVAGLMLRTKEFRVFEKRTRLNFGTNSEDEIFSALLLLLNELYDVCQTYRSIGVMLESLSYGNQSDLFQNTVYHDSALDKALDEIESKYGKGAIKRGNDFLS